MPKKKELNFDGKVYDLDKATDYLNEFEKESPRAAAIMGCAYLDSLLNELLRSRLIKDESLFKKVIDNLTYERRIILCYLTGIIRKIEKDDLIIINKIRNKFAHDINLNSFEEDDVPAQIDNISMIKAMRKANFPPLVDPRNKYTVSVAVYMGSLIIKLNLGCKRIEYLNYP